MDRLEAVDGRALGVVLNMVPPRRGSDVYGDGYGYGYGYGYAPEPGRRDAKKKPVRPSEAKPASSLEEIGFKPS
jgi:Mrp family chromosome partitioning ATPase